MGRLLKSVLIGTLAGAATMVVGFVVSPIPVLDESIAFVSGAVGAAIVNSGFIVSGLIAGIIYGKKWRGSMIAGATAGCIHMVEVLLVLIGLFTVLPPIPVSPIGPPSAFITDLLLLFVYAGSLGTIGGVLGSESFRNRVLIRLPI